MCGEICVGGMDWETREPKERARAAVRRETSKIAKKTAKARKKTLLSYDILNLGADYSPQLSFAIPKPNPCQPRPAISLASLTQACTRLTSSRCFAGSEDVEFKDSAPENTSLHAVDQLLRACPPSRRMRTFSAGAAANACTEPAQLPDSAATAVGDSVETCVFNKELTSEYVVQRTVPRKAFTKRGGANLRLFV